MHPAGVAFEVGHHDLDRVLRSTFNTGGVGFFVDVTAAPHPGAATARTVLRTSCRLQDERALGGCCHGLTCRIRHRPATPERQCLRAERPPLSSRSACHRRVVRESTPITVVSWAAVCHPRPPLFAHGSRVAVVVQSPVDDLEQAQGTVVVTALSEGRVFSVSGVIRDAAERSLSLDLYGDLRGSDPRHFERTLAPGSVRVSLSWDEHSVVATLRDVSEQGIAVVSPKMRRFRRRRGGVVGNGSALGPVGARVCHRIDGLDGPERANRSGAVRWLGWASYSRRSDPSPRSRSGRSHVMSVRHVDLTR